MAFIRLLPSDAVEDSEFGILLTKYATSAVVKETLNGSYIATISLKYDKKLWAIIQNRMVVDVSTNRGIQRFRIRSHNKKNNELILNCWHIFWDLDSNIVQDINIINQDANNAIDMIFKGAQYPVLNFRGKSEISYLHNCRIVRTSVMEAVAGTQNNSVRNRWGGDIYVDNYNFEVLHFRGKESALTLRYKKDVTVFSESVDTEYMVTRAMPLGADGLMLPEVYIDSDLVDDYEFPIIKKVLFDDIKLQNTSSTEGYATKSEAWDEIRHRMNELYKEGHVDQPRINLRVNMLALNKSVTYQYNNWNILNSCEIGNVYNVDIEQYSIMAKKRCISTTWNILTDSYDEVELGDFKDFTMKTESSGANLDYVAEKLTSGIYMYTNLDRIEISEDFNHQTHICTIDFAVMQTTHLNLALTFTARNEALAQGLSKMYLYMNGMLLTFSPMNSINHEYLTWTVTAPITYVKSDINNQLRIFLSSSVYYTIDIEQFYLTLSGQFTIGGLGTDIPKIDIWDHVEWLGGFDLMNLWENDPEFVDEVIFEFSDIPIITITDNVQMDFLNQLKSKQNPLEPTLESNVTITLVTP